VEAEAMTWTCTQCGACCRALRLGILAADTSELPIDDDGVCGNLDRETNLCRIYDTRPSCCRVTVAHAPEALTEGCNTLHLAVYGQERRV
jgi:Fe-S-cluster containining protein